MFGVARRIVDVRHFRDKTTHTAGDRNGCGHRIGIHFRGYGPRRVRRIPDGEHGPVVAGIAVSNDGPAIGQRRKRNGRRGGHIRRRTAAQRGLREPCACGIATSRFDLNGGARNVRRHQFTVCQGYHFRRHSHTTGGVQDNRRTPNTRGSLANRDIVVRSIDLVVRHPRITPRSPRNIGHERGRSIHRGQRMGEVVDWVPGCPVKPTVEQFVCRGLTVCSEGLAFRRSQRRGAKRHDRGHTEIREGAPNAGTPFDISELVGRLGIADETYAIRGIRHGESDRNVGARSIGDVGAPYGAHYIHRQ